MFARSTLAIVWAFAGPALAQAEQPLSGGTPPQTDAIVAGDWTIAAQNDQLMVFVKPAPPATEPGGFRRLSVRFEFAVPQVPSGSRAYLSMLVLTEFDCAQNRTRNVEATAFAAHNLVTAIGPAQKGARGLVDDRRRIDCRQPQAAGLPLTGVFAFRGALV